MNIKKWLPLSDVMQIHTIKKESYEFEVYSCFIYRNCMWSMQ